MRQFNNTFIQLTHVDEVLMNDPNDEPSFEMGYYHLWVFIIFIIIQSLIYYYYSIRFSHTGTQFYRFDLNRSQTWLSTIVNVSGLMSAIYIAIFNSPPNYESIGHIRQRKIFYKIAYFNIRFAYTSIAIIRSLYFLLYGGVRIRKLLLSSSEMNLTYYRYIDSPIKVIFILMITIIFSLYRFLVSYLSVWSRIDWQRQLFDGITRTFGYFIISISAFVQIYIQIYVQWFVRRSMIDIQLNLNRSISNRFPQQSTSILIRKIRNLALSTSDLNFLLSFPILFSMLNNIIDLIIFICVALFMGVSIFNFQFLIFTIFIFSMIAYNFYVVNLNHDILNIFDRITEQLRDSSIATDCMKVIHKGTMVNKYRSPPMIDRRNRSRQICFEELEQYRNLFQLRLFNMTPINMNVLFSLCLTITGLIVFVVQTN